MASLSSLFCPVGLCLYHAILGVVFGVCDASACVLYAYSCFDFLRILCEFYKNFLDLFSISVKKIDAISILVEIV